MSDIIEDLQLGLHVEPEKVIAVIQALRQRVNELEDAFASAEERIIELREELDALKQTQGGTLPLS